MTLDITEGHSGQRGGSHNLKKGKYDMIKRVADLLEKVAAGSFLIGLFQGQNLAIVFGLLTLAGSLALTWEDRRRTK